MALQQFIHHRELQAAFRSDAKPLSLIGDGVFHALICEQRNADLKAVGRGDEAILFEHFPGHVHPLGADEGEYVFFFSILAHKSCREAQASFGLQLSHGTEHRRREHVHFVVDDQAPIGGLEKFEMLEGGFLAAAVGEDLIRGDGDGFDLLRIAGVQPHFIFGERGLVQQLLFPLLHGRAVGRQYKRVRLQFGHAADADDGLARAAGQHQHARAAFGPAARVEDIHGGLLIRPQAEGLAVLFQGFRQLEGQGISGLVARHVLHRMTQADELQLHFAAHPIVQINTSFVGVGFRQHSLQGFLVLDFPEKAAVVHFQRQPVALLDQSELAVAGAVVLDFL